jgi:peptidoglycan/LPS O-acetylase OafA/YrhL
MSYYKKVIPTFSIDIGITTALKFICCIIIVLHHYSQYIVSEIGNPNVITNLLSSQGGYLAVSIFFFLSGYGLTISFNKKSLTFAEYLRKRFSKVYIPAVLVSIIWIIVLNISECKTIQIAPNMVGIPPIIEGIFKSFLLSFYDPVLWFVKVIIIFYGLLYLYKRFTFPQKLSSTVLLLAFTLFSTILVRYAIGPFASVSIPAFYIGVYIADNPNMEKMRCIKNMLIISIISISSLLLVGVVSMAMHGVVNIFVLFFIIYFFSYYNITATVPKIWGDISYDVYLVHNKVKILLLYFTHGLSLSTFLLFTTLSAVFFLLVRRKIMLLLKIKNHMIK